MLDNPTSDFVSAPFSVVVVVVVVVFVSFPKLPCLKFDSP